MSKTPSDEPTTIADLERKIDLLDLKLDRIKNELAAFGFGAIVVTVLYYFRH